MKYCPKCGTAVKEGSAFCSKCGDKLKMKGDFIMANDVNTNNQDMEFEQMMEQRIRDNFAAPANGNATISDERLREMSKKLPSWSLEPPYSFIK